MSALLSTTEIGYSLGGRVLFESLSLVVAHGERLAIIGANGAGKSTLLRLLVGEIEPDDGSIARRRALTIGYVRQSDELPPESSPRALFELVPSTSHIPLTQRLKSLTPPNSFALDSPVKSLSGGQRKRVSLIRELLAEHEVLFLDEPTNHLDIEGILWLEEQLLTSSQSCVFVSHDRYFIERVATRVVELDRRYPGGYLSVNGTYSDFLETREQFLISREAQHARLKNKVKRETEWLRQGVKARTTKAKYRIDEAHRLIGELNSMVLDEARSQVEFLSTGRRSRELIKVEHISKRYGELVIVKDLSLTVGPGTRIGLVGPNGSGKSTLLRLLSGAESPDSGRVKLGNGTLIRSFSQHREELDTSLSLRRALAPEGDALVVQGREIHVVSWAKRFLFQNQQLDLPVSSLSGGEQARLLLARLMSYPADVLFFDEPTNDLDIPTLEVFEESLCSFPGALVLVSHDRYLLDRVSTTLLGFQGNGVVAPYADYTQWEIARRENVALASNPPPLSSGKAPVKSDGKADKKELAQIEKKIDSIDKRIASLQEETEDPSNASNSGHLSELWQEMTRLKAEQEALLSRWEELARRL